jgi:putative peptidoglycan lipid II flippase
VSTDSGQPQAQSQGEPSNLSRQGGTVAAMTTLSRLTGFVRDMVLSYAFGASAVADAFFVAFRIPNFFRRLFAEGAFSQAFVPVLAAYRAGGDRTEFLRFIAVMSGHFGLVLALVCVLGVVAAPALVTVFAPGFWRDPEKLALTSEMVRITFPYLGFISLTAFAGALLNAHHRYAVPAFTPVLLNLSLMGAALFAAPLFEQPVLALAWGVFVAGVAQLLFQLPALRALGLLLPPRLDRRHDGVRRVGRLVVPAVFAGSVSQINALVDTMIASLLVTGSISWLYYADRLLELPIGVVAVAISTVLLPNLSRLNARGDGAGFSRALDWGVRASLLFAVPAAAALYLLAVPIVASIFHRGAMSETDVAMTALALKAFAVGLVALTMVKIAAPAYFAREDTRTPFRIALVAVSVNLALNLALFKPMGHAGLALATSCAAVVQAYLLLRGVVGAQLYRPGADFARFGLRVLAAVAVMGAVLLALAPPAAQWLEMRELERALMLAMLCAAGGGTYFLTLWLLGMRRAQLRYRV